MRRKSIVIILILLICSLQIFSQDENADSQNQAQKAFEFDIGGGLSIVYSISYPASSTGTIQQSTYIMDDVYGRKYFTYNILYYGAGAEVFLPVSIIFYPVNKFGIGFTGIMGTDFYYSGGSGMFELYAKTMFTLKAGSFVKKKFFICEVGVNAGLPVHSIFRYRTARKAGIDSCRPEAFRTSSCNNDYSNHRPS